MMFYFPIQKFRKIFPKTSSVVMSPVMVPRWWRVSRRSWAIRSVGRVVFRPSRTRVRLACAWEFVEKLPGNINANIGERGKGLSEGQAQRIAIARAILRDAPVLLLDEATSALDVATERRVLRNIVTARPNKTCIVTTHRPSVLSMCRRVYRVMDTRVTKLSEEESARMAIDF